LRAWATAARASAVVIPFPRQPRATKKQVIDHTGASSTGFSVRARASLG